MERVFLTGASMQRLGALWRGELPLGEAFWTWVVQLGIAVNVTTSILFYALVSADMAFLAFVAGYALSLPYNLLATVGAWRSAGRYEGTPVMADAARLATLALMAILSLT
jgi:hypothetical protein